jgi:hypothetical protein
LLNKDDFLIFFQEFLLIPACPQNKLPFFLETGSPLGIMGQIGVFCENNGKVWGEVLEKMGNEFENVKYKKEFEIKKQVRKIIF